MNKQIQFMSFVFLSLFALCSVAQSTSLQGNQWVKKKYAIKGDWSIVDRDSQKVIILGDNFKTKKGPDLKIYFSRKPVAQLTGKTVTESSDFITLLDSHKGTQEYIIPEGINLDEYQSLLIHCEEFSVLWGGADLN